MSDSGKPRKPRTVKPQPDDAGRAVLEQIAQTGKGTAKTGTSSKPKPRTAAIHKPAPANAAAPVKGKPGSAPRAKTTSQPTKGRRSGSPGSSGTGDRLGLVVLLLVILAAAGARFLLPGPRAALPPAGQLQLRFLDTQPGTVLLTSPEGQTLLYGLAQRGPDLLSKYGVKRPDLLAGGTAIPASWKGTRLISPGQSRLGSVKLRVLDGPVLNGRQSTPGLLLSYGEFRALLTGEAGPGAAQGWLAAGGESTYGPVQIYQGLKRGGDTPTWLAAVRPEAVVLSLGRAPTLGTGPDAKTLDLYRQTGARIWRSDVSGTVSFTATADGRFVAQAER